MPLLLRYNDRFKQKSRRKRCKACDDVKVVLLNNTMPGDATIFLPALHSLNDRFPLKSPCFQGKTQNDKGML